MSKIPSFLKILANLPHLEMLPELVIENDENAATIPTNTPAEPIDNTDGLDTQAISPEILAAALSNLAPTA